MRQGLRGPSLPGTGLLHAEEGVGCGAGVGGGVAGWAVWVWGGGVREGV